MLIIKHQLLIDNKDKMISTSLFANFAFFKISNFKFHLRKILYAINNTCV